MEFRNLSLPFKLSNMAEGKTAKDFISGAEKVKSRAPQKIKVGNKTYKVKQLRKFARSRIDRLNREAYWCEMQSKQPMTLKEAKRISKRLYSLHAKTAAIYLLGLWAVIPFVYAIRWRMLMLGHDDTTAAINAAGQSGDAQINFTLADWDFTKVQLAHSINLIGDGLKELEKRMESARRQAEEDATPKKQGDK